MALVSKNFSDIITFTRASTATYFDSAGVLQSAAINAPRLDYNPSTLAAQGLLIEESRTNSIRNNTMVGAVAGTPGTLPSSGWSTFTSLTGLTREVVGTGTESGITYIDIRLSGTPSAAGSYGIYFEGATQIVAASGQSWAATQYAKLAAGSTAGITTINNSISENTAAGGYLTGSSTSFLPTTAALNTQRYGHSRTLNNASTARVLSYWDIILTGAAIDITLRIGLPQLEQGAFATSVIPTTTTALTRAADVASVNTLSPWFNASAGTLYAEAQYPFVSSATNPGFAEIDNGTFDEAIGIYTTLAGNATFIVRDNNVTQATVTVSGMTANTVIKIAGAYAVNDFQQATNGTLGVADTSGSLPTVTRLALGDIAVGQKLNGWLRRVSYYPRRLSNAELVSITSP